MLSPFVFVIFFLSFSYELSYYSASSQPLPLPALSYSYHDLEPYYSEAQLRLHHLKHMQTYTDKLNAALIELRGKNDQGKLLVKGGIDQLLTKLNEIDDSRLKTAITNNGGGYVNHDLFFRCLRAPIVVNPSSPPEPIGAVKELIDRQYQNYSSFMKLFTDSAISVFGSGWTWLIIEKNSSDKLLIVNTANQQSPVMEGDYPLLTLDVWEHAYYKDYENRRPDFIGKWWYLINWEYVEERYQTYIKKYNNKEKSEL